MKAKCPHCQCEVSVNPVKRILDVTCPSCRRLVFREERLWGKLWVAFCALCALVAGILLYLATENIRQVWSIYIIYLVPAAIVFLLAPLGNVVMVLVHQAKNGRG